MIVVNGNQYELVKEFRNGWNPEAFQSRYSEILDKYDYIVGDWGFGQLRLRGFYDDSRKKVPADSKISTLEEYLQEYCNFGCAYFVLRKVRSRTNAKPPRPHGALSSRANGARGKHAERPGAGR